MRRDAAGARIQAIALSAALVGIAVSSGLPSTARAWGDRTHPAVNRLALETLPSPLPGLFADRADELARRSNEPDTVMRGRDGEAENIRHFIDLDELMSPPFEHFPRMYRDAVRRFGRQRLDRSGVLPWVILRFQRQLRGAIRAGDERRIVREAAYLGHYVADVFQPLHVTKNYDGQLSGAKGLHKRYEDGLVDVRIDAYVARARRLLRPATLVDDPRNAIFETLLDSYQGVETIVAADRTARGGASTGSPEYFDRMDELAGDLTVRGLAGAAWMLGSLWWTAWEQEHRGDR